MRYEIVAEAYRDLERSSGRIVLIERLEIESARLVGNPHAVAWALVNRASVAWAVGDLELADHAVEPPVVHLRPARPAHDPNGRLTC